MLYMGQKLQDGKKVHEMSQTNLHSESRPVQTIHPTDLGLLPSWRSSYGAPAQTQSQLSIDWVSIHYGTEHHMLVILESIGRV